ncbi:C-type lectin domain family 2 member L-like [Pogoniulus pusillus]|uniref:C-type lectin domain family 2 member L-like n=1 Tax=Pogoniulus pusillus TaxID=488313 RepID=UPI0030B92523
MRTQPGRAETADGMSVLSAGPPDTYGPLLPAVLQLLLHLRFQMPFLLAKLTLGTKHTQGDDHSAGPGPSPRGVGSGSRRRQRIPAQAADPGAGGSPPPSRGTVLHRFRPRDFPARLGSGSAPMGRGGFPERGTASRKGLLSNVWLWRGVAGVLTAAVVLTLYIQFVNRSSAKAFPVCPSLELCPSGWLYFQRKCYYLSESEASWNSSQSLCSLHNASLLVIGNQEELSFMVKITKEDPWIGLYKRNKEFFWVNGNALDNKLIEVKGSGNCAYLESKGVSASGCYLTRKWVCSFNVSLA